MFINFSKHAINKALDFNEELQFCTFSIHIHVVNFDLRANPTRAYEEKTCCTFWFLKDIIMKYEGRKHMVRDILYVRGQGGFSRL